MEQLTFSFFGLGLIGGSIARAIRASHPDCFIRACDTDSSTLRLALEEGVIDEASERIDEENGMAFTDCDFLFLCAPVSQNDSNLRLIRKFLLSEGRTHSNCILTDVGSVKSTIHASIEELGLTSCFIGGHPMAGSERIGFQNSKASLLENAYYILTPTPDVSGEQAERYAALVKAMGAIPLILDYRQHDYVTAAISHLPHVIASSLVNLVKASDNEDGIMKLVAAGGFKDITRIASSSTVMWQQICLTNKENISQLLERYISSLEKVKDEIDRSDAAQLYHFFDTARSYRDSFIDASSGPIKRVYTINVEIPDEAGSLASVATLLALNHISIKNIGIAHNRESEDGVLRIEFYEEASIEKAEKLLGSRGYMVFLKK